MTTLYDFDVIDIDGNELSLSHFKGNVLLLVNVASECGLTPQYTGLQKLQDKYHQQGFNVIGFPCNQFGKQEPGSEAEIKDFCISHFSVDFPMMSKVDVNGVHRHPVYNFLAGGDSSFSGDISWNFEKFLIDRDGKIKARFAPDLEPQAEQIAQAIELALEPH